MNNILIFPRISKETLHTLMIRVLILSLTAMFLSAEHIASATEIFADHATYLQANNQVNFYKNIKLVLENATLYSDRLDVTLSPGKKFDIFSLQAYQNLRLVEGEETITADKALYSKADNAITLQGNVTIKNTKGTLNAEQYRYDMNTRRGIISTDKPGTRVKIKLN